MCWVMDSSSSVQQTEKGRGCPQFLPNLLHFSSLIVLQRSDNFVFHKLRGQAHLLWCFYLASDLGIVEGIWKTEDKLTEEPIRGRK